MSNLKLKCFSFLQVNKYILPRNISFSKIRMVSTQFDVLVLFHFNYFLFSFILNFTFFSIYDTDYGQGNTKIYQNNLRFNMVGDQYFPIKNLPSVSEPPKNTTPAYILF